MLVSKLRKCVSFFHHGGFKLSNVWLLIGLGTAIRVWLMRSSFATCIRNSPDVSTPMNSLKRMTEGVFLYQHGIDPYSGSVFRETPISLIFFVCLFRYLQPWLPAVFVVCDIITALILSKVAEYSSNDLLGYQNKERKCSASCWFLWNAQLQPIPFYVLVTYLFNPYCIFNCVGLTTTVFANLFLALTYFFTIKGQRFPATFAVAFVAYQSFFPIILIFPVSIYIAQKEGNLENYLTMKPWISFWKTAACFLIWLAILLLVSYKVFDSWRFVNSVYGCVLFVRDLNPNIGLFWYFFTEMVDDYRSICVFCFQWNMFIHVLPLAVSCRRRPMLLFVSLNCLLAMYKSYPCVGDVGFYISLLPVWLYLYRYMRRQVMIDGVIVACSSVLVTITRCQWLKSGRANANFCFALTLAFSAGQVCLLEDILFSSFYRQVNT